MKILYSILFTIILIPVLYAQTNNAESLSWKGVTIDVSTAEDIIAKFGKPESDRTDSLDIVKIFKGKVFSSKAANKEWRILKYKEIEKAPNVEFGFNKENKLVFIYFKPSTKKNAIEVQAFLRSFEETNFKPLESSLDRYVLLGEKESGYIMAEVDRGSIAMAELLTSPITMQQKSSKVVDKPLNQLYGKISRVQFISKSLENTENTDVLK